MRQQSGSMPRRVTQRVLCVALWFAAIAAVTVPAVARAEPTTLPDAVTPVEEFSQRLEQLKGSFTDLGRKIEERANAINSRTSPEASHKDIEELRAIVASLLGAVADNGEVATLGTQAVAHARSKLESLRNDNRFTKEQREYLIHEWTRLLAETEHATEELGTARTRFAELLRTLQVNDDYINELLEIRQGQEALKVIHQLAKDIQEASDILNNFINGITPPPPGS